MGSGGRQARRQGARARDKSETSLPPDWVWGAGFGAIIVLFMGLWVGLGLLSGGKADACDQPLGALGTSTITAEAFVDEEAALTRVFDMLSRGDRAGAEAQFYGPVHGFTHNVGPPVHQRDEELARKLCRAVLDVETGLTTRASDIELSVDIENVRNILREVAVALGYPSPVEEPST